MYEKSNSSKRLIMTNSSSCSWPASAPILIFPTPQRQAFSTAWVVSFRIKLLSQNNIPVLQNHHLPVLAIICWLPTIRRWEFILWLYYHFCVTTFTAEPGSVHLLHFLSCFMPHPATLELTIYFSFSYIISCVPITNLQSPITFVNLPSICSDTLHFYQLHHLRDIIISGHLLSSCFSLRHLGNPLFLSPGSSVS